MALKTDLVQILETGRSRTIGASDSIKITSGIDGTPIGAASASTGSFTTLASSGLSTLNSLSVTNDASIGGDLTVTGDIVSRGAVDLVVQDNFIDLNFGNTTTTSESGGLTIAMNRNASFTASTVTDFVAGNAGVANPTFTNTDATGSTVLAAGDIVMISGAAESSNDGLYQVSAVNQNSFPQVVTIAGIGTAAVDGSLPFCQNQFTADTGDTAVACKVDLAVWTVADGTNNFLDDAGNNYAKGTFLTAYAAGAVLTDFDGNGDYTVATSTLQSAYNGGATIVTASSTDIAFTLTSGDFTATGAGAVNLTPTGASSFTSGGALTLTGGGASTWSTGSGALTINGAAGILLAGNAGEIDITTSGLIDVNGSGGLDMALSGAASSIVSTAQNLSISTATSGELDLTSAAALDLNGVAVTVDGSGGVSIGSQGAAADFTSTGQDLSISTVTSGTLALTGAALVDINAGANLDIDVTGTFDMLSTGAFSIDGTGASNVTAAEGNLTLATTTSGAIVANAAASNDVDLQVGSASFLLCDASANAVDISRNIVMGQTAASPAQPTQAISVELTADENLQQGALVYLSATGQVSAADANGGSAGSAIRTPIGACQTGITDTQAGPVGVGGVIAVRFNADGDGDVVGVPVYLSAANPGCATKTPPTTGTVYQIGIVHTVSASNIGLVVYQPALIADIT